MDADEFEDRARNPRLGSPFFGGRLDDMLDAWAWHLERPEPAGPTARPADDGSSRRTDLGGATPEHGELVVSVLLLPPELPAWGTELLAAFVDLLIQDRVALIWDAGGPSAVVRHLLHHNLSTADVQSAVVDDMVFLGMISAEVTYEVLDAADRIRTVAARCAG